MEVNKYSGLHIIDKSKLLLNQFFFQKYLFLFVVLAFILVEYSLLKYFFTFTARSVAEILRSTFTNTNLRDLFIESVINLLGPALDWAEMRLRMQISQYRILILGLVRRFLREHLHYESYEARLQP